MNTTPTENTTKTEEEFYNKLGYLYYGIAAASGTVDADTMSTLKRCVSRIWMLNSGELSGFQGYTPNKVEAKFDWLNLNETDWDFCVGEFVFFMKQHKNDLSDSLKTFAMDSADEVSRYMGAIPNPALKKMQEMLAE